MSLKEAISVKHAEAENEPFIKSIFAGTVDVEKYVDFIFQKYVIYSKLEEYANKMSLLVGIEDIARSAAIRQDYIEIDAVGGYPIRKSTKAYANHLDSISTDPQKIMAHIYVHHMGDMFGGQMLKKLVPGSGKMYEFENRAELIQTVRTMIDEDMADEANVAFQLTIDLLKEYA